MLTPVENPFRPGLRTLGSRRPDIALTLAFDRPSKVGATASRILVMSTCAFYFGGYKATETDVNAWVGSAQAQRSVVQFTGYPWPSGAASDDGSAVTGFTKSGQFAKALAAIEASTAERIYLVGHSSGCAIANAVDRGLKDHSKIVLVALDGFAPDPKQLGRPSTQVWSAENGKHKSLNYKWLKRLGGRLRMYPATNATTELALHFSIVNSAATDKAVTTIPKGYTACVANLAWL